MQPPKGFWTHWLRAPALYRWWSGIQRAKGTWCIFHIMIDLESLSSVLLLRLCIGHSSILEFFRCLWSTWHWWHWALRETKASFHGWPPSRVGTLRLHLLVWLAVGTLQEGKRRSCLVGRERRGICGPLCVSSRPYEGKSLYCVWGDLNLKRSEINWQTS